MLPPPEAERCAVPSPSRPPTQPRLPPPPCATRVSAKGQAASFFSWPFYQRCPAETPRVMSPVPALKLAAAPSDASTSAARLPPLTLGGGRGGGGTGALPEPVNGATAAPPMKLLPAERLMPGAFLPNHLSLVSRARQFFVIRPILLIRPFVLPPDARCAQPFGCRCVAARAHVIRRRGGAARDEPRRSAARRVGDAARPQPVRHFFFFSPFPYSHRATA